MNAMIKFPLGAVTNPQLTLNLHCLPGKNGTLLTYQTLKSLIDRDVTLFKTFLTAERVEGIRRFPGSNQWCNIVCGFLHKAD